jgi:hypothetical protein
VSVSWSDSIIQFDIVEFGAPDAATLIGDVAPHGSYPSTRGLVVPYAKDPEDRGSVLSGVDG